MRVNRENGFWAVKGRAEDTNGGEKGKASGCTQRLCDYTCRAGALYSGGQRGGLPCGDPVFWRQAVSVHIQLSYAAFYDDQRLSVLGKHAARGDKGGAQGAFAAAYGCAAAAGVFVDGSGLCADSDNESFDGRAAAGGGFVCVFLQGVQQSLVFMGSILVLFDCVFHVLFFPQFRHTICDRICHAVFYSGRDGAGRV